MSEKTLPCAVQDKQGAGPLEQTQGRMGQLRLQLLHSLLGGSLLGEGQEERALAAMV